MARGYPGAFGRQVNALYMWLPCASVRAAVPPVATPPAAAAQAAVRRWHLDLLVLLSFSISLAFFNHAEIGLSVPLAYPCLIYLLMRMLLLAFGRGRPRLRCG